jgi:hypothetical protein
MSTDERTPVVSTARSEFAAQLHELEEFVARARSDGEELPPQAMEMMSRVREIMEALDGLSNITSESNTSTPSATSQSSKPEPS